MKKFMHKAVLCLALLTPFNMAQAVNWDESDGYPWGRQLHDIEAASGAFYMTLGPTGIRAKYIDASRNTMVVMYVFPNSPADGKIQAGDVITGVNGGGFTTSAIKNGEEGNDGGYGGPFKEFGEAIQEAQGSDGVIPVTVLRQASTLDYDLTINITGNFSTTYPYNCPKSTALLPKLINYIESDMEPDFKWDGTSLEGGFYCRLAMMSSTDPAHFATQTGIAHAYADGTYATLQESETGSKTWAYSFASMFLCEYYLRFKDDPTKDVEWVIPELEEIRDWLYEGRYQRQHHLNFFTHDGWGHRHQVHLAGYGAFMYPTPMVILQFGLMNRCGVTIDREYIDGPFISVLKGTNDTGHLWYQGNKAQASGLIGDRARSSMAAMANYFATTHDTLYVDRAKLYAGVDTAQVKANYGYASGHGSNLTHMFAIGLGQRLNPSLQRTTLDAFRTWYALSETEIDGQFVTQPTRSSVKSGGRGRAVGSALLALILQQPNKSLHLYGKGGGNGEPAAFNVPLISGSPALSVNEGVNYNFTPSATDADGDSLTYSIANKPAWASFDTATGQLSGMPSHAHDGTYDNIVIAVKDAFNTTELPAFSLVVNDVPLAVNNKVKVFILAGQSNMQGKGAKDDGANTWNGTLETLLLSEPAKYSHLVNNGDVNSLTERSDVSVAYRRDPTNPLIGTGPLAAKWGTNNTVIGPELGAGERIGDALNEKVLIVKVAFGGTNLHTDWRPPSAGGTTGLRYTAMITDVNAVLNDIALYVPGYAGEGVEVAGFGWWQGWNDATTNTPKTEYENLLVHLGHDVRAAFNAPVMPIVVASSGNGGNDPAMPGTCLWLKDVIEPAQEAGAGRLTNASFYSTRNMWNDPPTSAPYLSWSHWNYSFATYYDVGTAMGDKFVELLANGGAVSANQTPFISGAPDTVFDANGVAQYSFTPTATDNENDTLTYFIEGMPVWGSFDSATGEFSGVPTTQDVGEFPITISVSDGMFIASLSYSLRVIDPLAAPSLDFTVDVPSGSPVISGTNNEIITINGSTGSTISGWEYTVTANTILEFDFAAPDPASAKYHFIGFRDASNAQQNFYVHGSKVARTDDYDVGPYDGPDKQHFRVKLTEFIPAGVYHDFNFKQLNQATATCTFSDVKVYEFDPNANTAPTFTNSATPSFVADGISSYTYVPATADYESDPVTVTTQGVPSWATLDPLTGGFTGVPTLADVGSYHVIHTASDGLLTTDLVYDIEITNGTNNLPPEISGTPVTSFQASGATYNFTPTASDPEFDTLTFSITGKPSWATFSTITGGISGTPALADVGIYNIVITVSDGTSTADLSYDLTVTAPAVEAPIDFSQYAVNGELPHHESRTGTQSINGTSITFTGKMNGDIARSITVTANTVLEFDFSSTQIQKRHWIGLKQGGTDFDFWFAGTSGARAGDIALTAYTGPGVQNYTIRLADYLALGEYDGLFIKQLGGSATANGTWSNVKVYEDVQ